MKSKPLLHFKVRPNSTTRLYAEVFVWRLAKDMRAHLTRDGMTRARDTAAVCRSHKKQKLVNGKWTTTGSFCAVHFYRATLGGGIVAHEMLHATFAYARRKGLRGTPFDRDERPNVSDDEEACTLAHGEMVAKVIRRFNRERIW